MGDPQKARDQMAPRSGSIPYSSTRIVSIVRGACGVLAKLALMATVLAVILYRVNPPARAVRTPRMAPIVVGPETDTMSSPKTIVYDPQTGQVDSPASRVARDLYYASGSPWRDELGRTQMVGVLSGFPHVGPNEPALVRISVPDGSLLDRVQIESFPRARPCWFPDRSARILFIDSRCRLARLDFEARSSQRSELQPTTFRWRSGVAGADGMLRGDISWPTDPRLNGRILVSMSPRSTSEGVTRLEREQIWWLQLDQSSAEITAAGRLTYPLEPNYGLSRENYPVISADASGRLLLSYLENLPSDPSSYWRLKVVPVAINPLTGDLTIVAGECRTLSERCVASFPNFSNDARSLRCLTWPEGKGSWQVRTFAINDFPADPLERSPERASARTIECLN